MIHKPEELPELLQQAKNKEQTIQVWVKDKWKNLVAASQYGSETRMEFNGEVIYATWNTYVDVKTIDNSIEIKRIESYIKQFENEHKTEEGTIATYSMKNPEMIMYRMVKDLLQEVERLKGGAG